MNNVYQYVDKFGKTLSLREEMSTQKTKAALEGSTWILEAYTVFLTIGAGEAGAKSIDEYIRGKS